MATFGSDDVAFLLIDGYSVLGVTTQITYGKEAVAEETHALGDAWVEHTYVGLRRASLTQNGFFDDAANGVNDALVSQMGTARVLCLGVEGNTLGEAFTGFAGAMQMSFERVASRGELHKANAAYQGSGAVEEGIILHIHQAETGATLNGTNVDNGASSANGASGYLQVSALALGGYTNAVLKIQHSVDNSVWVDLISFVVVTAAPNAQRLTVAGTVNRHLRATLAYTGAGAGQSITYMVGAVRT